MKIYTYGIGHMTKLHLNTEVFWHWDDLLFFRLKIMHPVVTCNAPRVFNRINTVATEKENYFRISIRLSVKK